MQDFCEPEPRILSIYGKVQGMTGSCSGRFQRVKNFQSDLSLNVLFPFIHQPCHSNQEPRLQSGRVGSWTGAQGVLQLSFVLAVSGSS